MANTFAQHLLELTRNSTPTPRPVKTSQRKDGTTYASVVLMMAVGTDSASAVTDGRIASGGAASSGSVSMSMVIPERLDVRGIAPIDLNVDNLGTLSGQTTACVSGHGSGQYHLSAFGSGNKGAFEATQGGSAVRFEVAYSTDATRPQPVTMGEALERLAGAGAQGCGDNANNATLSIRVNSAYEPRPGSDLPWRGALTLLLAPE